MAYKSFAEMKKNRSKASDLLKEELAKQQNPKTFGDDDENVWYPAVDKVGNGEAIIRFMPAPMDEDYPFVKVLRYAFKGPGGWYIENSLRTNGRDKADPVAEYISSLWDEGTEESIKEARSKGVKTVYTCNVYIIKDKLNPENEGKVLKFRFGKKIFEKLNASMNPEFEGDSPVNPFCLLDGANFRLRIKMGDNGYRNYDSSRFDDPSPLFENDDKLEAVWKQCHSLADIVSADKFKTYDELKARFVRVMGKDKPTSFWESEEKVNNPPKSKTKEADVDESEDDLAALKSLMSEDD